MFEEIIEAKEKVEDIVNQRLKEFKRLREEGITHYNFRPFLDLEYDADVFSELCFCLLTANSSATLGIKIQKAIGVEGFKELDLEELSRVIESHKHRFPKQRAERIIKARERFESVMELLKDSRDGKTIRDLLSDTCSKYKVEGFGMKEASHFLRNVGYNDVAIVDRHVLRFLKEKRLIPDVKTLTRRIYLQAERALDKVCEKLGMTQAELDLYIFYVKTKKVLK